MAITKHFGAAVEDHLRTAGKWTDAVDIHIAETVDGSGEYEIKKWVVPTVPQPNEATINGWITTWEAKGEKYPDSAARRSRKQAIKAKLGLTDQEIIDLADLISDRNDQ